MTALRILNMLAWGALFAFMLPAAWNAAFGSQVRRGDAMRLGCLATACVILGFNLRALLAPSNAFVWSALEVLSIADAIYILSLGRAYGRGPNV